MTSPAALPPTTPVLIGAGVVTQRETDPAQADEPIELMIRAAREAGQDAGVADLLRQIDRILVPVGRWSYGNPGAMIGEAIGSPTAVTLSAHAGISQQTILSDAASAIAAGDIRTALIAGGEAGNRLLQAKIAGVDISDTEDTREPDHVLRPDYTSGILADFERETALGFMPVGYYAILETAWRHATGMSIDAHKRHIAERYARFSEIGAANPHGWNTDRLSAAQINQARTIAYPYGKHHVSNWNVDQASALLMTSVAEAERLGVARDRWIFPQAFTESNHAVIVSERGTLHESLGTTLAAAAALEAAACRANDLDFVELYTCFPIAVELYAQALGLAPEQDLSFTGAMPFGGGPFNNFVLHSTAQLAHLLRSKGLQESPAPRRGLVSAVSGFLTKQGIAIWGTEPNPDGYQFVDVSAQTAAQHDTREVLPDYTGQATVAGYTVMHDRASPQAGVAVLDLPDGARGIASTRNPALMQRMEDEDFCGTEVAVDSREFDLSP